MALDYITALQSSQFLSTNDSVLESLLSRGPVDNLPDLADIPGFVVEILRRSVMSSWFILSKEGLA